MTTGLDFIAQGSLLVTRTNELSPSIRVAQGDRVQFGPSRAGLSTWTLKISRNSIFIIGQEEVNHLLGQLNSVSQSLILKPLRCESCLGFGWDAIKERVLNCLVGKTAIVCDNCYGKLSSENLGTNIVTNRSNNGLAESLPRVNLNLEHIKPFTAVVDDGPIYVVYPANRFMLEVVDRNTVSFVEDFDKSRWLAYSGIHNQVVWDEVGIRWVHEELTRLKKSSDARLTEERSLPKSQQIQRTRFRNIFGDIE